MNKCKKIKTKLWIEIDLYISTFTSYSLIYKAVYIEFPNNTLKIISYKSKSV